NLKLSEKRAKAIQNYLVSKGIAADRFKVEWFGSKKPIADNKTEAGRQKNRRVEMLIIE
ncbi:MAG: outer membrane protein/peptidoglycan-associated protein, partial [Bacteroidetes bacterium]|nr:outer membrane protein/peptidoglycan-associated protein [Bacteroidota bacterium]